MRIVLQIKDGKIIKEWDCTVSDIGRKTGISGSTIASVLNENRPYAKSAGGFVWKYKE